MATSVSAKKRVRQNRKRRTVSRAHKAAIKTGTKKVLAAVEEKKLDEAQKILREVQTKLDKASGSTIHRNKASRTKSRLQRRINKATKAQQAARA